MNDKKDAPPSEGSLPEAPVVARDQFGHEGHPPTPPGDSLLKGELSAGGGGDAPPAPVPGKGDKADAGASR